MKALLLDTHAWIWYVNGSNELGKSIRATITKALHENSAALAAISLWEIAMLEKKQRIILEMPCLEWINKSIELTHINVLPLSPEIATESCYLPGKFHDDPADRVIVATARVEGLLVLTRDAKILDYSRSKFISAMKI
jgi:PIN domain nuclease of toxin-antitoxin system